MSAGALGRATPVASSVSEVLALYERWGSDHYDEDLSQLDHALQTAEHAVAAGAPNNLIAAALGIAVAHTALGPDHTLPFVMLARAGRWSLRRTLAVTLACGAGHVASSLLLAA